MADVKSGYSASTTITITLSTMASSAARQSVFVDNGASTALSLDALVQLQVKTNSSAPAGDKAVYVYTYGSEEGTTNYTQNANGTDSTIAFISTNPTNFRLLTAIPTPTSNSIFRSHPASVAATFGGMMPRRWGIVVMNQTGNELASTASELWARYSGVYATSTGST